MVRVLIAAGILVVAAAAILAQAEAEGPTPRRDSADECVIATNPDTGKDYLACTWRIRLPMLAYGGNE